MLHKLLIIPIAILIAILGWSILPRNLLPISQVIKVNMPLATPISRPFVVSGYRTSSLIGNFGLEIPKDYGVIERDGIVEIRKTRNQEIIIIRYPSKFSNLDHHLENFHKNNNAKVIENKRLNIDGFEAEVEILNLDKYGQQKKYTIFANGFIYDFSTYYPNLFPTLDSVAQSLKVQTSPTHFIASNVLDGLHFELPNGFNADERFATVTISNENKKILISMHGTNFDNLNDYIDSLKKVDNIRLTESEDLIINGLQTKVGLIKDEKVYLIYKDYAIYTISTTENALFPTLDKIAQSLKFLE